MDLIDLTSENPLSTQLLFWFTDVMGKETNAVACSYKMLSKLTGKSKSTVQRAISVLKEYELIDVRRCGSTWLYCVNADVYWQSSPDNKKYAYFDKKICGGRSRKGKNRPSQITFKPVAYLPSRGKNVPIFMTSEEKTKMLHYRIPEAVVA